MQAQTRNLIKDILRKARMETQVQKISFSLVPIFLSGVFVPSNVRPHSLKNTCLALKVRIPAENIKLGSEKRLDSVDSSDSS
ncbi:hypothetical protein F2Q70_00013677 [Brassica cretica]|uniref:Uncharacterized protein n=1 Tax=Brassica cretica TaxID=69181 RepID=A0A8S9LNS1_BRACR|nr:hypothetical protein F2Q70_00013677 [Brassica cretica]